MELTSFLVLVVYLVSFAGLTAAEAKQSGMKPWFLASCGAHAATGRAYIGAVALAAAVPLVGTWRGNLLPWDPVRLALDGLAADIIGHALMGVGACIAMVSQMHASELWRIGTDDRPAGGLIEDGPYALSRNPVFLGQMLLFGGLFLVLPGMVQGLLTMLLVGAILMQVRIEERMLAARYGEPYERYRHRVRRWIRYRSEPD